VRLLVALALLTGVLAAPDKRDFSGQWILVSPRKSDDRIAREMVVRHTPNEPDAPGGVLHVERRFGKSREVESEGLPIGIYGGTVNGIRPGETQASVSSRWSAT